MPLTFASSEAASASVGADDSAPLRRSTRQASQAASASITRQGARNNNIRAHFAPVTPTSSPTLFTPFASPVASTSPTLTIRSTVAPSSVQDLLAQPQQLTCTDLFRLQSPTKPDIVILTPDNCRIYFVRSFLSPLAITLFHTFLDALDDWQTGTLYGHPLPRVSKWYGLESYKVCRTFTHSHSRHCNGDTLICLICVCFCHSTPPSVGHTSPIHPSSAMPSTS